MWLHPVDVIRMTEVFLNLILVFPDSYVVCKIPGERGKFCIGEIESWILYDRIKEHEQDKFLKKFCNMCSAVNNVNKQDLNGKDSKVIRWYNKFICIGYKTVYFQDITEKRDFLSGWFKLE